MKQQVRAALSYLWQHAILFSIVVFLIAIISLILAFWIFKSNETVRAVLISLAATLTNIGSIRVFYETFANRSLRSSFAILEDATSQGLRQVFRPGSHPDWLAVMTRSSRITMFGISLNLLKDEDVLDLLTKRLNDGSVKVTLILCDPRSLTLQIRYLRDEPRESPSSWQREGLRVQATHIESLHKWHKTIKKGKQKNVTLKLSRSYPTIAIFSFDEELYFYPYVYGERGFRGPCFGTSGANLPLGRFLRGVLQRIDRASLKLDDKVNEDIQRKKDNGDFDDASLERRLTEINV